MKKIVCLIFVCATISSCNPGSNAGDDVQERDSIRVSEVNAMLDSLNRAAAAADFQTYFDFYTNASIFTGTDATERWGKKEFMAFAKPYFDKGKAWDFTAIERHVYFDASKRLAWFDELLQTQMKLCRGSGVLIKTHSGWKVEQYILSATVPNAIMDSVVSLKSPAEDLLIEELKANRE